MCSVDLQASTVKLILASDVETLYVRHTLLHFSNHLGSDPRCKTVGIYIST